jgi:hypothetical protein
MLESLFSTPWCWAAYGAVHLPIISMGSPLPLRAPGIRAHRQGVISVWSRRSVARPRRWAVPGSRDIDTLFIGGFLNHLSVSVGTRARAKTAIGHAMRRRSA